MLGLLDFFVVTQLHFRPASTASAQRCHSSSHLTTCATQGTLFGRLPGAATARGLLARASIAPDTPEPSGEQRLSFAASLPLGLAQHIADTGAPLVAHLRSNFARAKSNVAVQWPCVWLLSHPAQAPQTWLQRVLRNVVASAYAAQALPQLLVQPGALRDGMRFCDLSSVALPQHAGSIAQSLTDRRAAAQSAGPASASALNALPQALLVLHAGPVGQEAGLRQLVQAAREASAHVLVLAEGAAGQADLTGLAAAYEVPQEHVLPVPPELPLATGLLGGEEAGEAGRHCDRVREAVYWLLTQGSLSPRARM